MMARGVGVRPREAHVGPAAVDLRMPAFSSLSSQRRSSHSDAEVDVDGCALDLVEVVVQI